MLDIDDQQSPGTMTKSELIARLAERYPQLVAKDAEFAVKTILDAMAKTLAEGHRIEIRGFGSFALSHRPPRIGRNPKTGEPATINPRRVIGFRASQVIKARIDKALGG